jgi:ribosome-associated protein
VVHVFQKQIREFYNIEGLWGDARSLKIETSIKKEEA